VHKVASGLCHHVFTFCLEDIQPSQYVCSMAKQDAFSYSQTVISWHLTMVSLQEDDFLSVLQLLLMWIDGTNFVLLLNFMPT
jgi:hypothetical protein